MLILKLNLAISLRNLNVSRIIVYEILSRLYTTFFKVNKLRLEKSSLIISRAVKILLR